GCRVEKGRAQAFALLMNHDFRRSAFHYLVQNRERPRQRVARVARRARPFGVEHEYSDPRSINGFPAVAFSRRHAVSSFRCCPSVVQCTIKSTEPVHACRFLPTKTAFSEAFYRFLLGIELASAGLRKEVPHTVILLGTGISSAFVEVILVVNAII